MNVVSQDDIDELKAMPCCVEKILIELILDLSRHPESMDQIKLKMDALTDRIEKEDIKKNNCYEIDQLMQNINTCLARNDFNLSIEKLKELHGLIRDLNIPKLLKLCKENDSAIEEIKDKNIYLFLGFTGTGNFLKHFFNYREKVLFFKKLFLYFQESQHHFTFLVDQGLN
jgi:hypothetical protein